MIPTEIENRETLWRRLDNDERVAKRTTAGFQVSSFAFTDRDCRPSVDRHCLCPADLGKEWTREHPEAGVVRLVAGEVRQQEAQRVEKPPVTEYNQLTIGYVVDVLHEPDTGDVGRRKNDAHSVIELHPDYHRDKVLPKIRERLARIAKIDAQTDLPAVFRT